jgi:hypothetical protein
VSGSLEAAEDRAISDSEPALELSERLDRLSPEKRALVERALERGRVQAGEGIKPRTGTDPAPLSFSQQRIWFLEQWEPGAPTHNGARAFRLEGRLDVAALQHALEQIVQRHEVLRTVYVVQGREPRQVLLDTWLVPIPVIDLKALPVAERESRLLHLLREQAREPFDLSADVMLRATVFELGPEESALLIRLHHIAFDAFSDRIFWSELATLYSARVNESAGALPELPIQYVDFAVWQRARLQGDLLESLTAYWRDALSGAPPLLRLPTDRRRRAVQRHEGAHHPLSLPVDLAEGVAALARSESATVYMALLGTFAALLYRFSGEADVVVGTPIANRTHVELQPLIGFFSNTLALRNRLHGNPSFREVLRRTRETALGGYSHQELPFEKIVDALQVPRDASYNPLFQVNFRAQSESRSGLELPGIRATPLTVDIGFSRFDLALELQVQPDSFGGYFEYDVDLFDLEKIELLAADLEALLSQVVADPDRPILSLAIPGTRSRSLRARGGPGEATIRRSRNKRK